MSEEEIRLDQTKRVFDTLAELISKKQTCTYRYLIYDLLGFSPENYAELMGGLTITNTLVEKEELQRKVKQLENIREEAIELTNNLLQTEDKGYYQILFQKQLDILNKGSE